MIRLLFLFLILFFTACKKKQAQTVKEDKLPDLLPGSLTALPIADEDFYVLEPLGKVAPPGQTFPKDHGGFYLKHFGTPSNVNSPGKLRIIEISRDRHAVGSPYESVDYSVVFGTGNNHRMYLGHLATITPKLLTAANNFTGTTCLQYSGEEKCAVKVSVDVEAGELLGTGGTIIGQLGVDFGLYVNNKPGCLLDYFAPGPKAVLSAKIGKFEGANNIVFRTKQPLCGEAYQDIPGTLQGNWKKPGAPTLPYEPHIAFVKDMADPDKPLISIGTHLFGTPQLWSFVPQTTGYINRKFSEVTAGNTYCYNNEANDASVIVKLQSATSIVAEYRPGCNCTCRSNYDFSVNAKTFERE